MKYQITVYGTADSNHAEHVKERLDSLGIDYKYVDVDATDTEVDLERASDGKRVLPVIEMSSDLGEVRLSDPDIPKLEEELHRLSIIEKGRANISRP